MEIRDRIKDFRRVKASELRPNPKNWRTHPAAQQDALRGILAEIGFADALIAREVDGAFQLIDGHLRAETVPDSLVPVLILDVTDAEADKLLATLDPLAAMATASAEKLEELLKGVGTSNDALAAMLSALARKAGIGLGGVEGQDDVPEPLASPVTRMGDLWVLPGPDDKPGHRLLCGDSTKPDDVDRVMGGMQAALVATDPPYLVDYTGERPSHGGRDSGKDWSGTYHEIEIKDAEGFFTALFSNALRVLMPHGAVYCWHAHRRCGAIQKVWAALGLLDHQQIIWVKPASVFGRVYWHFRHEPCMMGWRQGSKPAHDSDHRFDSVWEVGWERTGAAAPGAAAVAASTPARELGAPAGAETPATNRGAASEGGAGAIGDKARPGDNEHPTQKPVELFARPIRRHTLPGQVCFEPCSGSGSQLIACEVTNRRCFAIEIEPTYVDVAIRRWQKQTGRKAVLESTGVTWDDAAAERGAVAGATPSAAVEAAPVDSPSAPSLPPRARRGSKAAGNANHGPASSARARVAKAKE